MTPGPSRNFLKVLVEGAAEVNLDIVAVHGLNHYNVENHAASTWTALGGGMWLENFLPRKLPNARILPFGYNSMMGPKASTAGVSEQAENLLNRLHIKRKGAVKRPIIFICHSLGGLIVKQALITAKVNSMYKFVRISTYGIAFFGTPHRGGKFAIGQLQEVVTSVAGLPFHSPENTFMEALKKDSLFSDTIIETFRHQLEDYRVLSFYETLPVEGFRDVIVDKNSATLGLSGTREIHIGLGADHFNICRFEAIDDDDYEQVEGNIVGLAQEAVGALSTEINRPAFTLEERGGCMRALQAPDYLGFRTRRVEEAAGNTFAWFLDQKEFVSWRSGEESSVLWIRGSPGKGRTVLSKLLLSHLEKNSPSQSPESQNTVSVIYFFFYGQDPKLRTVSSLIRSLIHQLLKVASNADIFKHILPKHKKNEGLLDSNEELWIIFRNVISDPIFGTIYCVIDALDECEESELEDSKSTLLLRLRDLFSAMRSGSPRPFLKVLITSRPNHDIGNEFEDIPSIELKATSSDLEIYVESRLGGISPSSLPRKFHPMVRKELRERAGGTFLWVSIVTGKLKKIRFPSESRIMEMIENLPIDLECMYQSLLDQMSGSPDEEIYHKLLVWVVYAGRPLTLAELEEALAIRLNSKRRSDIVRHKPVLGDVTVTEWSGGLLEVVDGTVCLVHQSAKDFIVRKRLSTAFFSDTLSPNLYLAKVCMTYLCFDDPDLRLSSLADKICQGYSLLEYAGLFWFRHITNENEVSEIIDLFYPLLQYWTIAFGNWWVIVRRKFRYLRLAQHLCPASYSPFGIAIICEIPWLAVYVMSDKNIHLPRRGMPRELQLAAGCRSTIMLQLLLERPGFKKTDITERVTLEAAANIYAGMEAMVLLLKADQDLKISSATVVTAIRNNGKALSGAMRWFLERASVDITESTIVDIIQGCGLRDLSVEQMELLLSHGNGFVVTERILEAAASLLNLEHMRSLLKRGKNIRVTEGVMKAAVKNQKWGKEIVEFLLEIDSGIEGSRDLWISEGMISKAARNRCPGVLKSLLRLSKGIKITEYILISAVTNVYTTGALKLLLDSGKDIRITERVVAAAAEAEHLDALRLFFERDENIEITERILISAAANPYNADILEFILGNGKDIEVTEKVAVAVAGGMSSEAFIILFKWGKDIKITENTLISAAENRYTAEILELLLGDGEFGVVRRMAVTAAGGRYQQLLGWDIYIEITSRVLLAAAKNDLMAGPLKFILRNGGDIGITDCEDLIEMVAKDPRIARNIVDSLPENDEGIRVAGEILIKSMVYSLSDEEFVRFLGNREEKWTTITTYFVLRILGILGVWRKAKPVTEGAFRRLEYILGYILLTEEAVEALVEISSSENWPIVVEYDLIERCRNMILVSNTEIAQAFIKRSQKVRGTIMDQLKARSRRMPEARLSRVWGLSSKRGNSDIDELRPVSASSFKPKYITLESPGAPAEATRERERLKTDNGRPVEETEP